MMIKDRIEIKTLKKLDSEIEAPSSKAHTLRALFIAAMAKGKTIIKNPLIAEDQKYAIETLKLLGVDIEEKKDAIIVNGVNGRFHPKGDNLYIGNSGATARVLVLLCALADKDMTFTGNKRMNSERPLQDLLDAVKQLGIDAKSVIGNGCPPVYVKGNSFLGGNALMKGDKSSQYFTAILLCAPYAKKDVTITVEGKLVSKPYINVTIGMMKDFGVDVINNNYQEFIIKAGQTYTGREYSIEGDFSSASFFFEAAAITLGRIKIKNLNPNSTQGDKSFLDFLEMMGCEVNRGEDFVEVIGNPLKGIKVDMCDYPDITIPLAVVAAFAKGTTQICNVGHLKYKESDRLEAPVTELSNMGIKAKSIDDGIIIEGGSPHGAEIKTYKDHRMVMSFAVAGLKVPGIIIKNPENVEKSYPNFFEVLQSIY